LLKSCDGNLAGNAMEARHATPDSVRKEILRLKSLFPAFGCRKIAAMFNRLFAVQGITVGKTFVADLLRQTRYENDQLSRIYKHKIPAPLPSHHTWGLDATRKTDMNGCLHPILGIIDHGARVAVCLEPLRDLATITILRALLTTIERCGKPRFLRTDNASQFHSPLFRFVLAALGVRQRFSRLGCPWDNGRAERLFGTLKERLNNLAVADFASLQFALAEFRCWYNFLRPHNHLGGRTPAEVWNRIDPYLHPPKEIRYVVAWDGLLTGYRLQY
jgi:putative transposase